STSVIIYSSCSLATFDTRGCELPHCTNNRCLYDAQNRGRLPPRSASGRQNCTALGPRGRWLVFHPSFCISSHSYLGLDSGQLLERSLNISVALKNTSLVSVLHRGT